LKIEAVFKFYAKYPAMALVTGGILFALVGAILEPIQKESSSILLEWAPWLVGLGIILHVLWLFRRRLF
jgi:hypothetical protein